MKIAEIAALNTYKAERLEMDPNNNEFNEQDLDIVHIASKC